MKELLEDIAAKLRSDAYSNEEHVRLSLVARLLQALGWDIWNPQEVNTEFCPVPTEDSTRVDIALFARRNMPVYVEVKAIGKIGRNLPEIERQMRDYNRNITAVFSILTDGRHWRFYLSRTGGEFSQKCFKEIDLLDKLEAVEDIELAFHAFLSKEEIANGRALREAEQYLNSTQMQRTMRDALPMAKRDTESNPDLGLAQLLVRRVRDEGIDISESEAKAFILSAVSSDIDTIPDNPPAPEPTKPTTWRAPGASVVRLGKPKTRTKTPSPKPSDWLSKIPELRAFTNLRSWKDICGHLGIEVGGDSARRKLNDWVKANRQKWPSVPEV